MVQSEWLRHMLVALLSSPVADDPASLLYVATLMGTVGKILRNMGLLKEVRSLDALLRCQLGHCSQAQPMLQRSLELFECHSDPDSSDVANAMFELGSLFLADKRYGQAITLHTTLLTCVDRHSTALQRASSCSP